MDHPSRRSSRLPDWDYSTGGWYFTTACAAGRRPIFGTLRETGVELSRTGELLAEAWLQIPSHFQGVAIDCFVVMPDHFHGILIIEDGPNAPELGHIVGAFKAAVTRMIRAEGVVLGPIWQRGYFDHIIRSSRSCERIREYIRDNPARAIARLPRS